ncbi:DUF2946 family protein [Dechloromonas sp. A34]|uniref:DUF2946 family protein n=1 Tax=Dechloromonas sp. A34 TaxID=447588 RepID=UPI002248A03F|nr:DUF2946 family protein [Dechloromonas sp. A34]
MAAAAIAISRLQGALNIKTAASLIVVLDGLPPRVEYGANLPNALRLRDNPVAITLLTVTKQLLFILLMLILPLQSVWAAASAYCQHEQGTAMHHFGHHAHQHQTTDKYKSGGGPQATLHADCAFCHLGFVGVLTSSLDVPRPTPASPAVSPEISFLPSIFLEGPERPKWASAV